MTKSKEPLFKNDRLTAAYHEAGHVVLAKVLGIKPKEAYIMNIRPKRYYEGATIFSTRTDTIIAKRNNIKLKDIGDSVSLKSGAIENIIEFTTDIAALSFAGRMANQIGEHKTTEKDFCGDNENIEEVTNWCLEIIRNKIADSIIDRTYQILKDNWTEVEDVAKTIYEEGEWKPTKRKINE